MKYLAKLTTALVLSLLVGAFLDGAHAATKTKHSRDYGGEALRPKKNLEFDGQSIQSLKASKYDSLSTLGGDDSKGTKRLYTLPANFQSRAADSEMEMRYRQ